MTQKDFRILAFAMFAAKPAPQATMDMRQQWKISILALVSELKKTNPLFNEARFIDACHTGEDTAASRKMRAVKSTQWAG
jgi:hypothetical protein